MQLMLLFLKQSAIAILLILIFWGWGRIFLKRLSIQFHSTSEEFFFSSATGLAVVIFFVVLLSVVGIMYDLVILFFSIGLVGLRGLSIKDKFFKWLPLLFLLSLPLIFITLYPPIHWDDISYHLPIAQSILNNHSLQVNEYIRYPVFPINGEMLFVIGLVNNPITAQLISWICLFILSIGVFSQVEKYYSGGWGVLGFSILMSNQILIFLGTICYIDIILSLFLLSGLIALSNYFGDQIKYWAFLSAFFIGIAIGVKYTALIFCLIIGLILIIKREWRVFPVYSMIVFIIGIPWYLRNYFYTGNPVWPFMSSIFGLGDIWNIDDYQGQFADFNNNGFSKTFLSLIKLPFYLSQSSEGGVNLIIWFGLLLALFFLPKKFKEWSLIIVLLGYTLVWFASINLIRYYAPVVPLLSILSTLGYIYLIEQIYDKKLKIFLLYGLVVVSLYYPYFEVFLKYNNNGLPPMNIVETNSFLASRLPTYNASIISANLQGMTYGLLNENMYFYGKGKIIGDWFGKARYSKVLSLINEPILLYNYLKYDLRVDNFLINKDRIDSSTDIKNLGQKFIKIYDDDHAVVYKLK